MEQKFVADPAAPEPDIAEVLHTDRHLPRDFAGRDSLFERHCKRRAPSETELRARGGTKNEAYEAPVSTSASIRHATEPGITGRTWAVR